MHKNVELEPLLESGGKYSRASEVGTLISELQDEIAGCQFASPALNFLLTTNVITTDSAQSERPPA